eukprot:GHRR01027507.1.p1 GENE.GHRR01027507.1~~GHRR01027507.1.p1  ORF type:complete len:182 (+),score=36.37 GHRR01027507.1:326-871(+)
MLLVVGHKCGFQCQNGSHLVQRPKSLNLCRTGPAQLPAAVLADCFLACLHAAISPGLVKEQKSYVLGEVSDPQLTHALMSMFLDPDYTLDPEFTAAAGACLLGVVNGYRTGRQQQRSSLSILLQGDGEAASRQLLKWAKWSLPDVGKAPQELPLLKGVRREVMYHEVRAACCGYRCMTACF